MQTERFFSKIKKTSFFLRENSSKFSKNLKMFTSEILLTGGTPKGERKTQPILTKYEKANAIGTRARQIGQNFPVFVDVSGMEDEVAMARKELYAGKCPLIVRRTFPDHTAKVPHFEDWAITELEIHHI